MLPLDMGRNWLFVVMMVRHSQHTHVFSSATQFCALSFSESYLRALPQRELRAQLPSPRNFLLRRRTSGRIDAKAAILTGAVAV